MKKIIITIVFVLSYVICVQAGEISLADKSAEEIVRAAFDYWRGKASVSTTDMIIHRPGWERKMTVKAWTRGDSDSLFVITKPAKDKGNGTLKAGKNMWMFNPKVNRVIKLPPSMMSQAWQGSDFSNNDLAKTDSLIKDYAHTIEKVSSVNGKKIITIKSIPHPDAPVIWGMIKLEVRDDNILLSETFFDEDLKPVKEMTSSNNQMIEDKLFPMTWVMKKSDVKNEYTKLTYSSISFKKGLDKRIFTVSNLKNPRR